MSRFKLFIFNQILFTLELAGSVIIKILLRGSIGRLNQLTMQRVPVKAGHQV